MNKAKQQKTIDEGDKPVFAFTVRQFMGIKELHFESDQESGIIWLRGGNGAGKTSAIEAFREVLAGGGKKPELIHGGADKAEILLELPEIAIRRSITEKGSYLKVDGLPRGATEADYVSQLLNPLAFNPVAFFEAKPTEQREMLLKLVPCVVTQEQLADWFSADIARSVDVRQHGLEVLAEVEKLLVDQRKAANAVVDELKNRAATLRTQVPEGFEAERWRAADVSAISGRIAQAGQDEEEKRQRTRQAETWHDQAERKRDRMKDLDRQIAALGKQQDELRADIAALEAHAKECEEAAAAIAPADVSQAQADLAEYTEAQGSLKVYDDLKATEAALTEAEGVATTLDAWVQVARAKPAELLAQAEVPLEGLKISADKITINDVPLALRSTGEQLRDAVRIARAAASRLKIICIDDVEKLDPGNLAILKQEMASDDFLYIVGDRGSGELTVEVEGKAETGDE
jgi:exonuclease SbcC